MIIPDIYLYFTQIRRRQGEGMAALQYQSGFGNHHETEAHPGALPQGQNSPQLCPHGLYAEQLSGTAFTVPRALNQRSYQYYRIAFVTICRWLYRILPSVCHKPFQPYEGNAFVREGTAAGPSTPNQLRWDPFPIPDTAHDFVDGLRPLCSAGSPETRTGLAVHIYTATQSMAHRAFTNSDGDLLFGT